MKISGQTQRVDACSGLPRHEKAEHWPMPTVSQSPRGLRWSMPFTNDLAFEYMGVQLLPDGFRTTAA
jgi:hypothetical protein